MKEKILEILEANTEKIANYCTDKETAAKEIAEHITEFIKWLIDDQEIFKGELTEKYLVNDNIYVNGKRLETINEFFQYWLENVYAR